jgi:hypothetical protein
MGSGLSRRRLLATLGRGLTARPFAAFGESPGKGRAEADLPGAGRLARRALDAWRRRPPAFALRGRCAICELGPAGAITIERVGEGGVRILLTASDGELEILRTLASPVVARIVVRPAGRGDGAGGPAFDTLRRVPAGFELTFSSELALRHAPPRAVASRLPPVYAELAARAVAAAASLLA